MWLTIFPNWFLNFYLVFYMAIKEWANFIQEAKHFLVLRSLHLLTKNIALLPLLPLKSDHHCPPLILLLPQPRFSSSLLSLSPVTIFSINWSFLIFHFWTDHHHHPCPSWFLFGQSLSSPNSDFFLIGPATSSAQAQLQHLVLFRLSCIGLPWTSPITRSNITPSSSVQVSCIVPPLSFGFWE